MADKLEIELARINVAHGNKHIWTMHIDKESAEIEIVFAKTSEHGSSLNSERTFHGAAEFLASQYETIPAAKSKLRAVLKGMITHLEQGQKPSSRRLVAS